MKPKPLRIGIDGRLLMHYEMRGFARHTVELFRAMKEAVGDDIDLISFSPGSIAPEFLAALDLEPIVFGAGREILWEQVELPRQLQRNAIDVFHVTGNRGLPYRHVCKYVITCHDIIDRLPEYCDGDKRRDRWRKRYADFASRRSADKWITVSQFSKQEIRWFHGLAVDDVVVISNGAGARFHERVSASSIATVQRRYGLPPKYLLFLGGFDKRKNVAKLVEAYAQLPGHAPLLVLAGEHKWDFSAVAEQIQALHLTERVQCPGAISDEDLPALYQGAIAFVYPSRYEGFGLQLVEAMASGLPVLASQMTSLPEVLGSCGLLFDPENATAMARQMERVVSDADLRNAMAECGRQRARLFSWNKAAEQTLALYRDLLGGNEPVERVTSGVTREHR
jgi:glycosyltransferase involved in cell wall biosynthesis